MVSCGLAGHRHCIVSIGSHTFHLCMLNLFIIYFIFEFFYRPIFYNYRPISLLPQFSKIVEQLFNARLDAFIEKHALWLAVSMGLDLTCLHHWLY